MVNEMNVPPSLVENDKVALIATARFIDSKQLQSSIDRIEAWGLRVVKGKHLLNQSDQFAGTDSDRASDLQTAIHDPDIKAIICYRGGYGTIRLLDLVDFSPLTANPKWICGYSDVTVLHSKMNRLRIPSIHSTMPVNFESNSEDSITSLKNSLFGSPNQIEIDHHRLNKIGSVTGELVGGNLSILHNLSGTEVDLRTKNKILILEDLDEYLYHIDRMLQNFLRSGKLSGLKGLIIGGMTDMNDNQIPFGKSAYEIISESVSGFNFPVCFDFPVGHISDNRSVVLGKEYSLEVTEKMSFLSPV